MKSSSRRAFAVLLTAALALSLSALAALCARPKPNLDEVFLQTEYSSYAEHVKSIRALVTNNTQRMVKTGEGFFAVEKN